MTKAALLDMIHQFSAISDQEVKELEKLVQNFPYCQTAHLLIAKASYDQGNMLANQKLRKAAVYATNRNLLRKLIYTTEATVSLTILNPATNQVPVLDLETAPPQPVSLIPENIPGGPAGKSDSNFSSPPPIPLDEKETFNLPLEEASSEIYPPALAEENQPEKLEVVAESLIVDAEENPVLTTAPSESGVAQPDLIASVLDETDTYVNLASPAAIEKEINEESEPALAPILPHAEAGNTFTASEIEELLHVGNLTSGSSSEVTAEENASVEPAAPENVPYPPEIAITTEPPSEPAAAPIIRYELYAPDEPEDIPLGQTLASFDAYLFKPERDEHPTGELKPATPEEFNYEVYVRNQLGYWLGSSRLGELLQMKDELTTHPPMQFYPDLILEYSKQNYLMTPTDLPPVSNVSRQFAIIDQFLKANPKLKSFGSDKVRPEPQDDLSFKSTKNTKNLASENLAAIMVRQGKIKKAIKIYEHLILKIPEKKAYFTAQIENLRNLT